MGYRTKRGSEFRSSSISYVIHNPAYIGINRHRINTESEYSIDGLHPAIIDAEIWNKAQSIRAKSEKKVIIDAKTDMLPFRVTCIKCNSTMKTFYAHSKGKKYKYLRCSSCSNYINVEKLEKAVSQAIIAILNNRTEREAIFRFINSSSYSNTPASMEARSIDSEINRLEKSRARYLSLFEDYKLSDTKAFIDRILEIEAQLKILAEKKHVLVRVAAAIQQIDYDKYFDELVDRLAAMEPLVLRHLSSCLIERIEAYKGKIKIVLYL